MFFSKNELFLELSGVFKIERGEMSQKSGDIRHYDSISVRLSGSGQFKTKNETITAKKGDLLYIPKNALYTQYTAGERVIAIHFINYTFSAKDTIEVLSPANSEAIIALVTDLYNTWKEKKQGYKHRSTSLLYELLFIANCQDRQSRFENVEHSTKLKPAMDHIHQYFRSETIDISALAALCAVSETYFRKLFKTVYAVSPKQYVINLKLETAAQLLQSKLYTVSEVCERSGFTDPKYFTKLFKRRYGYTPKTFTTLSREAIFR